MPKRSILFLTGGAPDPGAFDRLLETANRVGMRISILVAARTPVPPTYAYGLDFYGSLPMVEDWRDGIDENRAALNELAKGLETRLSAKGVGGEVAVLFSDMVTVERIAMRMALTADAVLIADDLREESDFFAGLVQAGLFQSPTGMMINALSAPNAVCPERAFVAWNGGLPAARGLHAALPLLAPGAEVTVALFDPVSSEDRDGENPGSDVARWLSHRGFQVSLQQYPSGGEEIGIGILKRAAETGADLVVTGAYGHSRMRQRVFGGTTRTLIEQTKVPVLLAH